MPLKQQGMEAVFAVGTEGRETTQRVNSDGSRSLVPGYQLLSSPYLLSRLAGMSCLSYEAR